jgi:hypothetical protein
MRHSPPEVVRSPTKAPRSQGGLSDRVRISSSTSRKTQWLTQTMLVTHPETRMLRRSCHI